MLFPDYRPRRLRQTDAFRRMIRETRLSVDDLILPLFAVSNLARYIIRASFSQERMTYIPVNDSSDGANLFSASADLK